MNTPRLCKRLTLFPKLVSVCFLCFTGQLYGLDYALYGVDNCYLQAKPNLQAFGSGQSHLLRCPLPMENVSTQQKVRVRLYTLPHQLASECHIAGSTQLATTYYRFSRFSQIKDIKRTNEGLIYEAKIGGDGFFASPSEGKTWKLKYEIQCNMNQQPFLHSYSVIRTQTQSAWVMY